MPKLASGTGLRQKPTEEDEFNIAGFQVGATPGLLAWLNAALQAEREALRAELETRHDMILTALAARENSDVLPEAKHGVLECKDATMWTNSNKPGEAIVCSTMNEKKSRNIAENGSEDGTQETTDQRIRSSPSIRSNSGLSNSLALGSSKKGTKGRLRFNSLREDPQGVPIWHPTRLVQQWWFDGFFCTMIFINTLILALEVQYYGSKRGHELGHPRFQNSIQLQWPVAEDSFSVADWIFGVIFTLEIIVKVLGYRLTFIWDAWNWCDSIIVSLWLVNVIPADSVAMPDSLLKLARMARLLRLLRLVRAIKGFDALYIMTTAMKGSLSVLWWSFVLLMIMQTMIAFFLTQILDLFYFNNDTHPVEQRLEVFAYFGTTVRCMFTMFELTLANWPTAARVLVEYVSEYYTVVTVVHKLTIGFAVIGVINGVFMQETFKVASTDDFVMLRQKERDRRLHMKKMSLLFQEADDDENGVLDPMEFRRALSNPKVKTWLAAQDLRVEDGDNLFKLIDVDGDEGLTAEELVRGVERLKGPARSIDLLAFMKADLVFKTAICEKLGVVASPDETDED